MSRVRDVLVKWSGGLPLEVRFRFCCVRWWWIQSRFRYRRVLVYARPALLSSRFGGLGSYAKQWIPFSGRRGEPFKVANTGSLIKLDLSISSRQVIDVVITVVFLHLTLIFASGKEATEIQQPSPTDVFNHKRGAFALEF
ncbi:hypothetical protein IGI04_023827 [Brassica rapa subsp. trilocularis]|uniref:Uncharacterized protein n=1 Tax=Brassica rapa subsp. trilocularis TaxID=1813537 RepID=A0ABQ7M505_BRACM|nr:hypothetical protein IGI04_023827 [Brassica rapa subsp. trilocularis]